MTDKLKALLKEAISQENIIEFSKDGRLFSVGAVDVWSGQIIYSEQMGYRHLLDHVLASASIPPIFPVVKITVDVEMAFVDGGLRDIIPLQRAIKKGYPRITAVVCRPPDYVGSKYPIPGSMIKHVERLLDILLTEIVDTDLDHIKKCIEIAASLPTELKSKTTTLSEYFDVPVPRIIRPDSMDPALEVDLMNFNSAHISRMIEVGRKAAKKTRP